MRTVKGLFVTGTDTGVGKTVVSCALAAALASRRLRVAVMKPCETGGGDDASRLRAASGRALDPELVCPYRFAMPASPEAAANAEGKRVALGRIRRSFDTLAADADVIIVEGAGGLLVPLGTSVLTADLVRLLELPLLVVARASLGTVNHTLLTVEAARKRELELLGVVLSRSQAQQGPDEASNPGAIETHGAVSILGSLPPIERETLDSTVGLAAIGERYLAVEKILSLL